MKKRFAVKTFHNSLFAGSAGLPQKECHVRELIFNQLRRLGDYRHETLYFFFAAAWQESYYFMVFRYIQLFSQCSANFIRTLDCIQNRVAYKRSIYAVSAVEVLLKRENDQAFIDVLGHLMNSISTPGPDLRADVVDYRDSRVLQSFCETQVELREINQNGDVWFPAACFSRETEKCSCEAGVRY